ncbi:MAG: flagellar hook-length control protein FliK, partial [Hyphomonadaceae bacterium]
MQASPSAINVFPNSQTKAEVNAQSEADTDNGAQFLDVLNAETGNTDTADTDEQSLISFASAAPDQADVSPEAISQLTVLELPDTLAPSTALSTSPAVLPTSTIPDASAGLDAVQSNPETAPSDTRIAPTDAARVAPIPISAVRSALPNTGTAEPSADLVATPIGANEGQTPAGPAAADPAIAPDTNAVPPQADITQIPQDLPADTVSSDAAEIDAAVGQAIEATPATASDTSSSPILAGVQSAPASPLTTTAAATPISGNLQLVKPLEIPAVLADALPTVDPENDRVVVQLDPPELGRVTIDFKFDGQVLQGVTITGESPEALRQLRQMHFELIQALEQNGLANDSLEFRQQASSEQGASQSQFQVDDTDGEQAAPPPPP